MKTRETTFRVLTQPVHSPVTLTEGIFN